MDLLFLANTFRTGTHQVRNERLIPFLGIILFPYLQMSQSETGSGSGIFSNDLDFCVLLRSKCLLLRTINGAD